MNLKLDRRVFISSLGGAAAVSLMSDEAKADALEDGMSKALDEARGDDPQKKFPTAAEVEAQIETRTYRRGGGNLFVGGRSNVKILPKMPDNPTFLDFFNLRFSGTANHCLQSANHAMKTGMTDEIVFACLCHDLVHALIKVDHGWWGAQMFEPYASENVTFAIRYHQALRFYEDKENGYEYPDLYRSMFGADYKPEKYIEDTYRMVRNHKKYILPRQVTINDLYAFDPNVKVTIDPFVDIIGRQFKQPKEGLGFDNSPVAHMWRSLIRPDSPL
jgi:HD domain